VVVVVVVVERKKILSTRLAKESVATFASHLDPRVQVVCVCVCVCACVCLFLCLLVRLGSMIRMRIRPLYHPSVFFLLL
jgi:hypothetical protein